MWHWVVLQNRDVATSPYRIFLKTGVCVSETVVFDTYHGPARNYDAGHFLHSEEPVKVGALTKMEDLSSYGEVEISLLLFIGRSTPASTLIPGHVLQSLNEPVNYRTNLR